VRSMFIALCCALGLAAPLAAQQAPTQYRLERIVVEGSDAGEDSIRAEARLIEERMYTEEDFRQAVYRVRRLPFVTDATYRLDPGVTGGGTTLVIRVLQETLVNFHANVDHVRTEEESDTTALGTLGGRFLLHDLGLVEVTADRSSESIQGSLAALTYRIYDIYGTGFFAMLRIGKRFSAEENFDFDAERDFLVGYPLTQKQSLTLTGSERKFGIDRDFDVEGNDDPDDDDTFDDNIILTNSDSVASADLRWWYESNDDPLFATRGISVAFGPRYAHTELDEQTFDETEEEVVTATEQFNLWGLRLDASAYRRLFGRNVGFLRLSGEGDRIDQVEDEDEAEIPNVDRRFGQASIGLAHDFHSYDPNVLRPFRIRLEGSVGYSTLMTRPEGGASVRTNQKFGTLGFIFRNRFGSVRLAGTYFFD
jgi:hypothetical protein